MHLPRHIIDSDYSQGYDQKEKGKRNEKHKWINKGKSRKDERTKKRKGRREHGAMALSPLKLKAIW